MQNKPFMKHTFFLFTVFFGLTQCTPKLTILELKDYKSIEGVKIGIPINSAIELIGKQYYVEKTAVPVYEGDDEEFEYIVYTNNNKRIALFSFNEGYVSQTKGKVYRLVIKNPRYITVEKIQIGMSIDEIKTLTRFKTVDFNYDDGLFITSSTFDGGYLMDLDIQKDYNGFDYENPKIEDLPGGLKVKEIML
ncbi:MAG: hypothetical protein CVT94_15685, partial [Bacteroidetes bacterium HGW-Bacteroidetes-11]